MINHTIHCRMKAFDHSDAAKRAFDAYALHVMADSGNCVGRWLAVALEDGHSDGVLYDNRRDCVIHQHHNEMYYAYMQITPGSTNVCELEVFLKVHREMHSKGIRLTDPDHRAGGRTVIPRLTTEDQRSQLHSIRSGGRSRPSNLILPGEF
jgi:hypothetical protein